MLRPIGLQWKLIDLFYYFCIMAHSLSTFAKFSKKLTSLTSWYARGKKCSFFREFCERTKWIIPNSNSDVKLVIEWPILKNSFLWGKLPFQLLHLQLQFNQNILILRRPLRYFSVNRSMKGQGKWVKVSYKHTASTN